jgi:hypothetical protein
MAEYKCKYCSQKFVNLLDLARHVRMHHKASPKLSGEEKKLLEVEKKLEELEKRERDSY